MIKKVNIGIKNVNMLIHIYQYHQISDMKLFQNQKTMFYFMFSICVLGLFNHLINDLNFFANYKPFFQYINLSK